LHPSHKVIALSTAIIVILFVSIVTLIQTFTALQNVNPVAVTAAVAVVVIGLVWFKKANKP